MKCILHSVCVLTFSKQVPAICLQGGILFEQHRSAVFQVNGVAPLLLSLSFTPLSNGVAVFSRDTDKGNVGANNPLISPPIAFGPSYSSCCRYWESGYSWLASNFQRAPNWAKNPVTLALLPECTSLAAVDCKQAVLAPLPPPLSCLCPCDVLRAVLGLNATCIWRNNSTMDIWPGYDAILAANTLFPLALKKDVLSAAAELSTLNVNDESTRSCNADPSNAGGVKAEIGGLAYAPTCSDTSSTAFVSLDGFSSVGGGGRLLEYTWTSTSDILGSNVLGSVVARVPATITLTVRNWLGASSSASMVIPASSIGSGVPLVSISGLSKRTVQKNEIVTLTATASIRNCSGDAAVSALYFSWQFLQPDGVVLLQGSSPVFVIPFSKLSLLSGTEYSARVFVTNNDTSVVITANAVVKFAVVFVPPNLVIAGGQRVIYAPNALRLDASLSSDPNNPSLSLIDIIWRCLFFLTSTNIYI